MFQGFALAFLTLLVSFIYSSVGHGGASGYLALLSFFLIPHEQMASSALCLNLLVSGTAFWSFWQAQHFSKRLILPFLATSIPFAFLGGLLKVPASVYSLLLAAVLLFAAARLLFGLGKGSEIEQPPSFKISLPVGGFIGILSGIVGVGGGIFLSPLLIFFRWAGPKKTAAASSCFIFVNSLAGLFGRFASGRLELTSALLSMTAAAFVGGLIGSRLGANQFSGVWLKRILSLVLALAAFKLLRVLA